MVRVPGWTKHDIRKPGDYGDGLHTYSPCMTCWTDDINGDGWVDEVVVGFPGLPAFWYENPKGKPGYWSQHEIWPMPATKRHFTRICLETAGAFW